MGAACFKSKTSVDIENSDIPPSPMDTTFDMEEPNILGKSPRESLVVNELVLQMLSLMAFFKDDNDENPPPLRKIHIIADNEEGWVQVVISMIKTIPLENPLGPSTITIIFDDCPLPSKDSVIQLSNLLLLSKESASAKHLNVRCARNICIILGCMAEKLAGPNSIAILSKDTMDYLITFLVSCKDPRVVLHALIALEKFAYTSENKVSIQKRFDAEVVNPLLTLEKLSDNKDYVWRQVGFCSKWMLDNIFIIKEREFSYKTVDMSEINVTLNTNDVSEYLKISHNGLEARCDSCSFESVRSTFQVDEGCWYYECTLITSGVMQIGWATKDSKFLNDEGYGIGDDEHSISYDGCRRLVWYKAKTTTVKRLPKSTAGDILGCLLDIEKEEVIFSLNGRRMPPIQSIFETAKKGFFAAASFMAFQQCKFNFGQELFKYPPKDRLFRVFNDFGFLTPEEKMIMPRKLRMELLNSSNQRINRPCTLCYDDPATCTLDPCNHGGFCSMCTSLLTQCPMCRRTIQAVIRDEQ